MKCCLAGFFILLAGIQLCQAQTQVSEDSDTKLIIEGERVKNVVYFELLGNGGIYSINFERRLDDRLWMRIGASYFPAAYEGLATFPIEISYLFGKQANFFELGIGATLFYAGSDNFLFNFDKGNEKIFSAGITGTIGYRFQPSEKDLFFKAALVPTFIPVSSTLGVSVGLSFGISF